MTTQIEIFYTLHYKNGSTESDITVEDILIDNELKDELNSFKERYTNAEVKKVTINSWNKSIGYKIN